MCVFVCVSVCVYRVVFVSCVSVSYVYVVMCDVCVSFVCVAPCVSACVVSECVCVCHVYVCRVYIFYEFLALNIISKQWCVCSECIPAENSGNTELKMVPSQNFCL